MYDNKNCICIIPARGGSKGIAKKNLINLCGTPLLSWTLLQAQGSKYIDSVYVSSDSDEILATAKHHGATAVLRPNELAQDASSSEDALKHVLASQNISDDTIVVFLQATSPLRTPEDIDQAIETMVRDQADSLFSMSVLDDFTVWQKNNGHLEGLTYNPNNRQRRQDRPPLYWENGSIYLFTASVLNKYNNRFGEKISMYEMSQWKSFEVDNVEDVETVEHFFKKYLLSDYTHKSKLHSLQEFEIDLIAYDFDGVMTDNRAIVTEDGKESVYVNRADGYGIRLIKDKNIPQVIISTEVNPVVTARAKKLSIPVIQAVEDKRQVIQDYCKENKHQLDKVIFIGNDLNDKEAMESVGFPICPSDAHEKIQNISKIILPIKGGEGVIRELANRIL